MHHSKPGLTYQPTNEEMDPTPDGSPHSRRRDEETGEPLLQEEKRATQWWGGALHTGGRGIRAGQRTVKRAQRSREAGEPGGCRRVTAGT